MARSSCASRRRSQVHSGSDSWLKAAKELERWEASQTATGAKDKPSCWNINILVRGRHKLLSAGDWARTAISDGVTL